MKRKTWRDRTTNTMHGRGEGTYLAPHPNSALSRALKEGKRKEVEARRKQILSDLNYRLHQMERGR